MFKKKHLFVIGLAGLAVTASACMIAAERGQPPEVETRTVDNFIMRLRKYFEPNPGEPIYFKSVRSAGYMFCEK